MAYYCLKSTVLRETRRGVGQIALALWALTDPTTGIARDVSDDVVREVACWKSRGSAGRALRVLVSRGYLVADLDATPTTYTWTPAALTTHIVRESAFRRAS